MADLKKIFYSATFLMLLSVASHSHAEVIETPNSIIINVNSPDTQGTSFNHLPANLFNKGKKIKILADGSRNSSLKNIVNVVQLHVDDEPLYLNSAVTVVGATTLHINSYKAMTCNGCSLYGADVITISTGSIGSDGLLTTNNNLNIAGDGLNAPGVSELNILAGNIFISGRLTTNVMSPSGEIASGLLRIIGGESASYLQSDYALKRASKSGQVVTQDGSQIRSAKIQASSSGPMTLSKSTISTQSNLRAVGNLADKNILWDGSIDIFSGSVLNNSSQIFAEGDVTVKASAKANYGVQSYIESRGDVHLISARDIEQLGEVSGKSINIAANSLTNEGDMLSGSRLFINVTGDIINQFGGKMLSEDDVILISNSLTNGSLRPYRFTMPYRKSGAVHTEGNFYDYSIFQDPIYSRKPVSTLEALIFARNIEIKTKIFTNTNPAYYLVKDKEIPLEPAVLARGFQPQAVIDYTNVANIDELTQNEIIPDKIMKQVAVIAMDNLLVNAIEKVDNASSILEATFGNMVITTRNFTNQRHIIELWNHDNVISVSRHENYILKTVKIFNHTYTKKEKIGPDTSSVTTEKNIYAMFNSPTGRVYVGKNLIVNATDGLVNKNSVIEVAGDFDANFTRFLHAGLGLNKVSHVDTISYFEEEYCAKKVWRKCIKHKTKRWTTMSQSINDDKDTTNNRFRSIYAVNGHILGKGKNNIEIKTIFANK